MLIIMCAYILLYICIYTCVYICLINSIVRRIWFFANPWTAACQASLSISSFQGLLKLVSIELVMPFNHLMLCLSLILLPSMFPSIRVISKESLFSSGGQSIIRVSVSAWMNSQDWFPLGWTGWISMLFKGLSRVFSNTTVQKHQFFGAQFSSQSNSHTHTWPLEKP